MQNKEIEEKKNSSNRVKADLIAILKFLPQDHQIVYLDMAVYKLYRTIFKNQTVDEASDQFAYLCNVAFNFHLVNPL